MSVLFESYNLSGKLLRNRIVMAPMTRSRAVDTIPNDLTVLYYSQRASAGLIISEGLPVSPQARGYLFTPGIYNEEQVSGWKKVTDQVHKAGSTMFAQLWHVGRVSHKSIQPNQAAPVSSSNLVAKNTMAYGYDENNQPNAIQASEPQGLTIEGVKQTQQDFVNAAKNAIKAGFDGVEIHGANGYLFEQFINPTANNRSDVYGGSIENRLRMLLETIDAVSAEIGSNKVAVRIAPFGRLFDMHGFADEKETWIKLAEELSQRNLAYVHLSDQSTLGAEGIPEGFPQAFRTRYKGTLIAAGGFTKDSALNAINNNEVDLVAFGRPFISNPDLVERMQNDWPITIPDRVAFYGDQGEKGYVDFPAYNGS